MPALTLYPGNGSVNHGGVLTILRLKKWMRIQLKIDLIGRIRIRRVKKRSQIWRLYGKKSQNIADFALLGLSHESSGFNTKDMRP
jgi:hypothetical protein